MSPDEFKSTLAGLAPGNAAHVNYEMFEILFPPGVEDDGAKGRAYKLAEKHGCIIEHRARDREVLFVKQA